MAETKKKERELPPGKKKHSSHAITSDLDIGDTAVAADFFLSGSFIIICTLKRISRIITMF